jgi:competence protein ComEA
LKRVIDRQAGHNFAMKGEGVRLPWSGLAAIALAGAGIGYIGGGASARPNPPQIVEGKPDSHETFRVQVSGAVNHPGVFSFSPGQRVEDAIAAAGGIRSDARLTSLNLAEKLTDELSIVVPDAKSVDVATTRVQESPASKLGASHPGLISLNKAGLKELDSLPGVGPAIAQRIIDFRVAEHGIMDIDELAQVDGISLEMVKKIRPLVRL